MLALRGLKAMTTPQSLLMPFELPVPEIPLLPLLPLVLQGSGNLLTLELVAIHGPIQHLARDWFFGERFDSGFLDGIGTRFAMFGEGAGIDEVLLSTDVPLADSVATPIPIPEPPRSS